MSDVAEQNMRKCKTCGILKVRIQDGKFKSGNKRWVSETGQQWSGNYCADCNRDRAKNMMNKLRKEIVPNGTETLDS